jgi:hypothetical protein
MERKIFILIIICCILVPTIIFSAYQIGVNSGYNLGKEDGAKGLGDSFVSSSQQIYQNGYQAGLKAAQNGVTPAPSP